MTTKPPRQREGKPFPGGKKLRKALSKLVKRKETHAAKYSKKPGSMK